MSGGHEPQLTTIAAPMAGDFVVQGPSRCQADGPVVVYEKRPAGYDLWLAVVSMSAGATLTWTPGHAEEVGIVLAGTIEVCGVLCAADTVIGLETNAEATASALEPSRLVMFGSSTTCDASSGIVHIVGPGPATGLTMPSDTGEGTVSVGFFLDGTCDGCSLSLLDVSADTAHSTSSHNHSRDEIIYVAQGTLRTGPNAVSAGMAMAVPANRQYLLRSEGRFRFLNFRSGVSIHRHRRSEVGSVETAEGYGHATTGVPHHRLTSARRGGSVYGDKA